MKDADPAQPFGYRMATEFGLNHPIDDAWVKPTEVGVALIQTFEKSPADCILNFGCQYYGQYLLRPTTEGNLQLVYYRQKGHDDRYNGIKNCVYRRINR